MPAATKVRKAEVPVQEKFAVMRRDMAASLIERDEEIDITLTALIAKENVLLVGPPGTAKSMLLDTVMDWMAGNSNKFSVLFNKFTTPEEVFGPVSVMGLKSDKYRRITTGKLPEADWFFGDEVFKASTAILNTMLRILNEGVFENGDGVFRKVPLIFSVFASNEWPNDQDGGKELGALFDRMLIRKTVNPISTKKGRDRLLWKDNHTPQLTHSVTRDEIKYAQLDAQKILFSHDAKQGFLEILEELGKEGIKPGDRRMFKAVKACKAYAYLNGANYEASYEDYLDVKKEHLEILAHILWDDPAEQAQKCRKVVARIANPTGSRITELLIQVEGVKEKFGHNEHEVIPKLKEIQKELGSLPHSGNRDRIEDALKYVTGEIKYYQQKIVGVL